MTGFAVEERSAPTRTDPRSDLSPYPVQCWEPAMVTWKCSQPPIHVLNTHHVLGVVPGTGTLGMRRHNLWPQRIHCYSRRDRGRNKLFQYSALNTRLIAQRRKWNIHLHLALKCGYFISVMRPIGLIELWSLRNIEKILSIENEKESSSQRMILFV